MGRGRGRGRKITNGRTHEDKGSSGEEVVVPARKRRGRPQKRVAEKINQAEVKEVDDGDVDYKLGSGDDAKLKASRAENISAGTDTNKRNRVPKEEEDSNLDMEENSSSTHPPATMSRPGPMASVRLEVAVRARLGERQRRAYRLIGFR